MNQQFLIADLLDRRAARRDSRRAFLKAAGTTGALVAGSSLLAACKHNHATVTPPETPPANPAPVTTDADILNFALNLEYLEANFYAYATTGSAIDSSLTSGTGTAGSATGGRQVKFTDPAVMAFAREIANDEREHVAYIRRQLGASAVAQPAIDVGTDPTGAFSTAAQAAGLVASGASFDPYASDENFLLGAFLFEDVGVTAYKGASPLISDPNYLSAAAGILAAEAYHAGLIRTVLYQKGLETPSLISAAQAISDARDSLDGSSDLDQGITPTSNATNLVPTDSTGIVFSRSTPQVLDIVYLTPALATKGGFFPAGVNGTINASGQ